MQLFSYFIILPIVIDFLVQLFSDLPFTRRRPTLISFDYQLTLTVKDDLRVIYMHLHLMGLCLLADTAPFTQARSIHRPRKGNKFEQGTQATFCSCGQKLCLLGALASVICIFKLEVRKAGSLAR